jgi:hypothetical protein
MTPSRERPQIGIVTEVLVFTLALEILAGLALLAPLIVALFGGSDLAISTAFALPGAASALVLVVWAAGGSLRAILAAEAIPWSLWRPWCSPPSRAEPERPILTSRFSGGIKAVEPVS